jgi:hypothetical protein
MLQRNIAVENDNVVTHKSRDGRRGETRSTVRGTRREEVEPNPLSGTKNMIRLLVLAISALMALSAGTATAAEMTVKVAGKSTPQIHADLVQAAKAVCREDLGDMRFGVDLMPYCVRDVTRAAIGKVGSPELIAYDKAYGRSAYLVKINR